MFSDGVTLSYSPMTYWLKQDSFTPIKKENLFLYHYQPDTLESLSTKKRTYQAISRCSYETNFDNYLDFNPHLWHPERIYSLSEVLTVVMGDSSDFQLLLSIISRAKNGSLDESGKFLDLLLENFKAYEQKLLKKIVAVTHQEVICFYILRHACVNTFGEECGKHVQEFNQSIFPNLISNLSIPEKGQLVRYANLIDYPNQEEANRFRALIGPHLYKLVRDGTEILREWKSVKSILQHVANHTIHFTDPFQSALKKNLGENSTLDKARVSIYSGIKEICLKLIAQIESGVEVQLPKFAHSVGRKTSKDGLIPELFFADDIREINSEEANMAGAFESTRIEETYQLPALMLTYENEWRKDRDLKNYFIPMQEGSRCTDYWLGWKKTIPICRRDFSGSVKGSSIFGIVVEDKHVEEQKRRLLEFSTFSPHLSDIFVLSRDEALYFERSLKKFPLFLPLHLQEKTEINTRKKAKTEAQIPPAKLPLLSRSHASVLSVACRNLSPEIFSRQLEKAIREKGKIYMMCEDSGLVYSQNDKAKFPNEANQQGIFHLSMLMLFTISNPDMTQRAIMEGLISPPLITKFLDTSNAQHPIEKTRSQLIQKVGFIFPNLKCTLPPGRRNIWPHQKLHAREIVGFNPLLSFNFIKIQTLLARESIELFYWYDSAKFIPQTFFKLLALQILSKAVAFEENQNQVLQATFLVDRGETCDAILDHNTFDAMDEEYAYNTRLYPNEPLLTHFLILDTGVEIIRSAILKNESEPSEKVALTLHFLSEVAKGIEQRYFFKSINPNRKLARTLDNSPLLAIYNMLGTNYQANILDIHDYNGLLMKNSKQE